MRTVLADLLCVAGIVAVVYGLYIERPSLAWIAGGASAVLFGVVMIRRKDKAVTE